MGLRNQIIEGICKRLKRLKTSDFEVRLRTEYGTPKENSRELIELLTRDFDAVRIRKDETNIFVGRFLGFVLLIEAKLEDLLIKVDSDIESKMLGKKIDSYRRLIKELGNPIFQYDPEELEMYQDLIEPLREIANIRNKMAHDLRYTRFKLKDIPKIDGLIKRYRPELRKEMRGAPPNEKPLVAVATFAFIVAERTSEIEQSLD